MNLSLCLICLACTFAIYTGSSRAFGVDDPNSPNCPANVDGKPGWRYWNGACYLFMDMAGSMSWMDAENACVSTYGSHLASITSKEENKYIRTRINQAWIGLKDADGSGNWQWTDGSALDYTNWDRHHSMADKSVMAVQPDNVPGHSCVFYGFGGTWFNDPCYSRYITRRFVCKRTG